jgi:predicted ArsR family transcriptional regulator
MFGERQQTLLRCLLHSRPGLSVDQLARQLKVSRNAVNQHLAGLQNGGYVASRVAESSRGRPGRLYFLTARGLELFPRHYDMFSNLLLGLVGERMGADELRRCLKMLGQTLAGRFADRVRREPSLSARLQEVATIMEELGYDARSVTDAESGEREIVALNCVFHALAEQSPDVCTLDLSLISELLGRPVEHRECMVRGGQCCRFGLLAGNHSAPSPGESSQGP